MRPWKRRLSDDERSVLLSELLLRHPELVAEAECREDTSEDLLLVRMGLPGAADDLVRIVYAKVKSLHLSIGHHIAP